MTLNLARFASRSIRNSEFGLDFVVGKTELDLTENIIFGGVAYHF
ncbi:MAG: hypothetical protein ACE5HC_15935 [Candidatus Binatia bacterium]